MRSLAASRPLSLYFLTASGALLGALLALDGLHARLFGEFLPLLGQHRFWLDLFQGLPSQGRLALQPVDPFTAGWLPVVIGTAFSGALAGLWMGLRWGLNAVAILATLSLLHGSVISALAAVVLLLTLLPETRRWMRLARGEARRPGAMTLE